MRQLASLLLILGIFLGQACTTTNSRTQSVEIFRDGEKPTRAFKEIGILTDDGGLAEQGEIEQKMIKTAKKNGADALIFEKLTKSGGELKGFGIVDTYLYKARMVVYQ